MYCIECARENDKDAKICAFCGAELHEHLDDAQMRKLIQMTHKRENVSREHFNGGLVSLVLGAIFLIIGILFIYLSFKTQTVVGHSSKVFSATCFEFYVALAGIISGSVLIIRGIIIVSLEKSRQNKFARLIASLRNKTFKQV